MKCVILCFLFIFLVTIIFDVSQKEFSKELKRGGLLYSLNPNNQNISRLESVTVESVVNRSSVVNSSSMESVITNSPVNDLKVFVPFDLRDLYKLLEPIALNGTVMTSFTDSGYLRHFYTFYRLSHLERYPNFFVTAIDQNAFDVQTILAFDLVSSFQRNSCVLLSS